MVQPSIDTGIQYRQDFVQQIIRSLSDGLSLTGTVIKEFDLVYHHKSLYLWVLGNRYVKRVTSIGGGQGADYGETGLFVE